MNYSQRKHLERMIAEFAPMNPDPFGLRMTSDLFGMKVIESPDRPRYTLPDEIIPGVPWPAGFRNEINKWSRSFLGMTNMLPRGTAYVISGSYAVMRPADVVKLSNMTA